MPSPDMTDHEIRARILRACSILLELYEFEPVGYLIETARGSLVGHDGITLEELERLSVYADYWASLSRRLRRLYAHALASHGAPRGAAIAALWHAFSAHKQPSSVAGHTYGILRREWVRLYGYHPPIELVPKRIRHE